MKKILKKNSAPVVKTATDKEVEKERKEKLIVVIICLALSALAVMPFFFLGEASEDSGIEIAMPVTHDMHLHYEQMESFYAGLSAGEIYPRWEEDTNRGFGAPTTCFYPPGIYYLTSLMYAISGDWIRALLHSHLLMMIASAAGIYIYARQSVSRAAATVAMAAYIFLPYHLIDQYQRGAIAELLSFVWMPLILLFAERLFKEKPPTQIVSTDEREITFQNISVSKRLSNISGLALSLAAFVWSHPPTAYQFLLVFGIIILVLACMQRDWKGLLMAGAASALGLAMSAAYLYPAVIEQDFIRHEYVAVRWPYHESYIFWHNLPDRQYHIAFFGLLDSVWVLSAIAILGSAILLLAINRRFTKLTEGLYRRVILWTILGAVASFLMTRLSYPIGRYIPKIDIGVFAWRMNSITTLAVALLAGACLQAGLNARTSGRGGYSNTLSIIAMFITVSAILFSIFFVMKPIYGASAFVPEPEHINDAMIPRTAPEDPRDLPDVERAELVDGAGEVLIKRWDTEHRVIEVDLKSDDRLMIRTFYFPGWTIKVDGQSAPFDLSKALRVRSGKEKRLVRALNYDPAAGISGVVTGEESLGDIVIHLTQGRHEVMLDFERTSSRQTGTLISTISVVLTTVLGAFAFVIRRKGRADETGDA